MKQLADKKTMELLEPEKRGRGRPPKADALTGAERAKRFRDAHRGTTAVAVTETVTEKQYKELQRAEQSRTRSLESAHAEIRLLLAKIEKQDAEIAALKKSRKSK